MAELSSSRLKNSFFEEVPNTLGTDCIFIHGNFASRRWWYPLRDLLLQDSHPSKSRSMWLVDFRGCGQALAPDSPEDVLLENLAEDLLQQIENLKIQKPINLVGHSTGGAITLMMMSKKPELFHNAILLDSVGLDGVKPPPFVFEVYKQMKVIPGLLSEVIGRTIYKNNKSSEFFQNIILPDAEIALKTTGDWVVKALMRVNLRESVAELPHSVLVLHGEFDQLLPKTDSIELAEFLPNAKFQEIPGQGHCCNVENPICLLSIMTQQGF
jgi:pimeloyl-ACP methyl ester carboxylesterase